MNALLIIAAIAVRNPFWPIGYEGTREVISAEPAVDVRPAAAAAEDDTATAATAARSSQTISGRHWTEARKTLRIGGIAVATDADGGRRQCVMINGLAYGDGDLISVNHDNRRFTWRVQGLTDGATIKLVRVRARMADADAGGRPAPGSKRAKEKTK